MDHSRLFILVEGVDDEIFFRDIIKPHCEEKWSCVRIIQYAQETKKKIRNYLRSFDQMRADYVLVHDIGGAPCVSKRKEKVVSSFGNVDPSKLMIVIMEIESWYLAGLDQSRCQELGVAYLSATDRVTKQQFDDLIPKKWLPRSNFMQEILRNYCTETARLRNRSFAYFLLKHMA